MWETDSQTILAVRIRSCFLKATKALPTGFSHCATASSTATLTARTCVSTGGTVGGDRVLTVLTVTLIQLESCAFLWTTLFCVLMKEPRCLRRSPRFSSLYLMAP